jgi:hypothetical protein
MSVMLIAHQAQSLRMQEDGKCWTISEQKTFI